MISLVFLTCFELKMQQQKNFKNKLCGLTKINLYQNYLHFLVS